MPTLETYQDVYIWHYIPSLLLAATFASLFALTTAAHVWKMNREKMWFCLPFAFGGISEAIGYAMRAASTYNTGNLILYVLQSVFLVIPPVFFAATLYMVYSRIIRAVHGELFSLITLRWATKLFVTGDVLCLLIQGNASGLLANSETTLTGDYIIIAGLILQIIIFVCFIGCCVIFNRRFRVHMAETGDVNDIPWQACLNMLYMTSTAILARNIFRVVEFSMQSVNETGYLVTTEWPLYVFDAALMLLVMIGFFVWYPSRLQSRPRGLEIDLATGGASSEGRNHVSSSDSFCEMSVLCGTRLKPKERVG